MMKTRILFSFMGIIAVTVATFASPIPVRAVPLRFFAAPGGLESGACANWSGACELRYVLNSMAVSGDEVWVKAGLHKPTASAANRVASFDIAAGVKVYGGFSGVESNLSQRTPKASVTILSGDIDGNDINTDGNNIAETTDSLIGNNSYHVVTMQGNPTPIGATTVLDGFVVTAGQAHEQLVATDGGGFYCDGSGSGHACSPTLSQLTFSGNHAIYGGGAFLNGGDGGVSSPTFTDVTFTGNTVESYGGGIDINGHLGASSPSFSKVTFTGNRAVMGGAVHSSGTQGGSARPVFTNVTFYGNIAQLHGGALSNDGYQGVSSPILLNVTFSGNSAAAYGGAIHNYGAELTLVNVILWANTAGEGFGGPEIHNDNATASIYFSVVQGGCASIAGAACVVGNISTNPNLDAPADHGGYTKTMALLPYSSAIETGLNAACPSTDQRGVNRPQGPRCDIGAYEYNLPVYIVGKVATSGGAGVSGVRLGYMDGTPKTVTSDGSGYYTIGVPYDWSGTVTPFSPGVGLSPASRTYSRLIQNQATEGYTLSYLPIAGIVDDASGNWNYTGAWVTVTISGLYNNTLRIGANQGATAVLPFYGAGFSLTYMRYTGWGNIGLYLDGSTTPLTTINTNGAAGLLTYTGPDLIPGPHTLLLKHTGPAGSFIAFDKLEVLGWPTQVGAGLQDGSDPPWNQTGSWVGVPATGLYNDTLHIAAAPNSTSTLFFNGVGFWLAYLQYPGWGQIAVYLDGSATPLTVINSDGAAAQQVYESPELSPGLHMLRLAHAGPPGRVIGVDGILVFP